MFMVFLFFQISNIKKSCVVLLMNHGLYKLGSYWHCLLLWIWHPSYGPYKQQENWHFQSHYPASNYRLYHRVSFLQRWALWINNFKQFVFGTNLYKADEIRLYGSRQPIFKKAEGICSTFIFKFSTFLWAETSIDFQTDSSTSMTCMRWARTSVRKNRYSII
jgi:hypothetical protein